MCSDNLPHSYLMGSSDMSEGTECGGSVPTEMGPFPNSRYPFG